jgi:hypothetical protein
MIAKMRNPWNKESYHGKFSDSDGSWTAAWKAEVNLVESDDGIFWMPYDTYVTYFRKTSVALTRSFAKTTSNDVSMP